MADLTSPSQSPADGAGAAERERLPHPQAARRGYRRRIALALALLVFLGLAIAAHFDPYLAFDPWITHEVQTGRVPWLDQLMRWISAFGYVGPATALMVVAVGGLLRLRFRVEALFTLLTVLGDAFGQLVKLIVARPRPGDDAISVLFQEAGRSFPSGHVLHYTIFFGFLLYLAATLLPPGGARAILCLLLALPILLIGVSRVYLGAHWASDVLGGYLLGGLWLAGHVSVYRAFKARWELVPHRPFVRRRPAPAPV